MGAECGGGEFALKNNFGIKRTASNPPGKEPTAKIKPAPGNRERVTVKVAVATVNRSAIIKIGNDQDISLVISRAGFEPAFKFTRIIGGAQVCVPNAASDLKAPELVYQKDVDHAGHRVGTIHSRRAIFQDVDVINHRERNEIDVHARGARATDIGSTAKPADGNAFSIDQNQSFFWQQTPQVRYDGAIAANGTVLVNRRAHLLRQIGQQVRCIANAQFFNVSLGDRCPLDLARLLLRSGMFEPVTMTRSISAVAPVVTCAGRCWRNAWERSTG